MGELSEQNQALIERVNPSGMPRAFTSASQETLLNRLIAAAPALLEAVADFCRVYEGFQDGDGNPCPQVARGLAALRLATEPAPFSPTPSKERTMEASELIEAARAVASEFAHGHPLIARLRDAVLAAEALSSGEAVAWRYRYPLGNGRGWTAWSHCSSRVNAEDIAGPGGEVEPLYAAPALSTPMPSREEVALDRADKAELEEPVDESDRWVNIQRWVIEDLLDAARTEGRGEGQPVAWAYEYTNHLKGDRAPGGWLRAVAFEAPTRARVNAGFARNVQPLYASPIREPEISRTGPMFILPGEDPVEYMALMRQKAAEMDREVFLEELAEAMFKVDEKHGPIRMNVPYGALKSFQRKQYERYAEAVADAILNLAPVGGRGEEAGWLIERQDLAPYPLYMRHTRRGHSWTPDPNEAARFATKDEASAECCGGDESGPLKVTEHVWQPLPPPPQEQGGMK